MKTPTFAIYFLVLAAAMIGVNWGPVRSESAQAVAPAASQPASDGPAWVRAIETAPDGTTVQLPPRATLRNTITVTGRRGICIRGGDTFWGSEITWAGPPNVPAFRFVGCNSPTLRGFMLYARKSTPLLEGIRVETARPGNVNAMCERSNM